MSDPVAMSLDDYIKSQKKTGKIGYGRNRRGPKANAGPRRGGGGGGTGAAAAGTYRGGGQNSFRGRKGRQDQGNNNVQGRWSNRGTSNRRSRGQFAGTSGNSPRGNFQRFQGGGGRALQNQGQGQNKRQRNPNRQNRPRRQRNSSGRGGQVVSAVQGVSKQRYFNKPLPNIGAGSLTPKRNQPRRLRLRKNLNNGGNVIALQQNALIVANKNRKGAFLKLAKKRVQRAKLLVGRRKAIAGAGKLKKVIAATSTGRLALGSNGFVTVKNTKAKQMERALVQMKIQRAQQARNRISPQRNVSVPGPSMRKRPIRARKPANTRPRTNDWNPIVRTMTNDLADEMTSSQLNPDIQRKIAFIQSRSNKSERAPVMPDFKAPVTTSRMKLSDRFRLLRDN